MSVLMVRAPQNQVGGRKKNGEARFAIREKGAASAARLIT
jgi:hypothetical protein